MPQAGVKLGTLDLSRPALNPIALRKAKIVCNFGLSECNRVNPLSYQCSMKISKTTIKFGSDMSFLSSVPPCLDMPKCNDFKLMYLLRLN